MSITGPAGAELALAELVDHEFGRVLAAYGGVVTVGCGDAAAHRAT